MKKPLLTIALGTTLAIAATGTATSVTAGGVTVTVPGGAPLPACSDLTDNDGDGQIDLTDPGCSGPLDGDEYNPPPAPPPSGGGGGGAGAPGGAPSGGETGAAPAPATPVGKTGGSLFDKKGGKGGNPQAVAKGEKKKIGKAPAMRNPDGSPADANPGLTIAQFGPAPIGVPNFVIDQFEIPPFLLPIYQACGTEYSIPWQVLASINRIETNFGRNLNVSSAGAMGWMQFIPSSWDAYGVDANEDDRKDPYNPVDAICAAARYLKAAGAERDLRDAIFAYNHADWYVDEVLLYANQYGKLPSDLVGSLTGLTEGAHFPVAADARYADDISEREALQRSKTNRAAPGNAADVIADSPTRRGINIYSSLNAPVVAVNDGVIKAIGENAKLGKFIVLQDAYGNRYTYAQLGSIAANHPVPRERALTAKDFKLEGPDGSQGPAPSNPASSGADTAASQPSSGADKPATQSAAPKGPGANDHAEAPEPSQGPVNTEELRDRLFALPDRSSTSSDQSSVPGQLDNLLGERVPAYEIFKSYASATFKFDRETMELRPLKIGSTVSGGTVLGQIGQPGSGAPYVHFSIRPAGRGAPKIDPKPILDGWKLLETTAIYRAAGKDPFGTDASVGGVLLMSKPVLEQRVLADPRLEIYSCGRSDIESGQIDRRILAALSYLVERGYRLGLTSLKCGHSFYTTSGNVSAHSSGNAVDIATINGISVLGNQGPGSITEAVVRDLMSLQGTMYPDQIITLMDLGPPTFAMGDHADHIHLGYQPPFGAAGQDVGSLARVLKPDQWERLIDRLGEIDNPEVPRKTSDAALPAGKGEVPTPAEVENERRSSDAHQGE
jgi:murein DD-endopeptidase MepM/ murein hydrolase activator NlpD